MSKFIEYFKQLAQGVNEAQNTHTKNLSQPIVKALAELQQELNTYKQLLRGQQKTDVEAFASKNELSNSFKYYRNQYEILKQLEKKLLDDQLFENEEKVITDYFQSFKKTIPHVIEKEQSRANFRWLKSDGFFLKGIKTIKTIFFVLNKLPRYTLNAIRKLFKKPVIAVNYWNHKVYLQLIVEEQYYSLLESLALFKKERLKELYQIVESLMSVEMDTLVGPSDIRPSEIKVDQFFIQYKNDLNDHINSFFKQKEPDYLKKTTISGTIEQPLFTIKNKRNAIKKKADELFTRRIEKSKGAMLLLINKWKFVHELFIVTNKNRQSVSDIAGVLEQKLCKSVLGAVEQQQQFVDQLHADIENISKDSSEEELRSYIVKGIFKINRTLKKQVAETNQILSSQKLLNAFSRLEVEANESLLFFSNKIGYAEPKYLEEGILIKDISFFNPQQVVQHFGLKDYMENLQKLKHNLSKSLDELNNLNNDFQQSLDFCFDSSLLLVDNEEETGSKNEPFDVLFDGLKKANVRNNEIKQRVISGFMGLINKLMDNVTELAGSIQRLQISKHHEETIQRLQREMLLQKTEKYKNRLNKIGKNIYLNLNYFIRLNYRKLQVVVKNIKTRLHLTIDAENITSELSNFLVEIHANKSRLPLVYQNLFELKPIDEINLFQGRGNELNKLNAAYKDWQSGNYAATIITGENGSGKSSLLNNFKQQNKFSYKVYYFVVDDFYYNQEHFYKLLTDIFGEPINNKKTLQGFFDESRSKLIVLIDGLEKVFLRKVNGNICIQKLMQLIAQTNKQVFWVATSSKYAWNYLNKTLQVNDFFDYKLELGELKKDEIKQIILKRNRLSGYKIYFEPDKEDLNNKTFKKQDVNEQQTELENKYFTKLNRFAISNISLALTYWLYSIHKIKEDTLTIKRFNVPEFSFVNNLSSDKVYTLLIIVFHSKINVAHHAEIFNQSMEKSSRILLVMTEDGILVKKGEFYVVHSVLLRHIIDLLKKRNLIH